MEILKDVRVEVAKYVGDSGTCPDEPEVVDAINRARRLLYPLGEWKNTISDLVIQGYSGTITLPAAYELITKAYFPTCRQQIPNEWFFVVADGFDEMCRMACKPVRMNEPVVTFRELGMMYGECFFRVELQYESDREADGTEVVVIGYNKQGGRQELRRVYDGRAFFGITENPAGDGPAADTFMRTLTQIVKPSMIGRVRIYAYIPDTTKRLLVSILEKDDINPSLTRYRFQHHGSYKWQQYAVQVKKRYRALVNDNDPVDISTEGLIHALQAISARDSKNTNEFNIQIQLAQSVLNRELGERESREQAFIRMSPAFGEVTNLLVDSDLM